MTLAGLNADAEMKALLGEDFAHLVNLPGPVLQHVGTLIN